MPPYATMQANPPQTSGVVWEGPMDKSHSKLTEDWAEVARRRVAALDADAWLPADSAEAVASSLTDLLRGLHRLDELELGDVEPATTYRPVGE